MLCCACLSHLDITGRDGTGRDGLDRPRGQIVIYNAKGLFCFSSFFGLIMYRDHLSLPLDGGGGTLDELFTTFLLFETTKRELMMADDGSLSLFFLRVCGWYVLKQSEKKIVFFFFFFFSLFFWKAVLGPPTGLAACCLPPAKSSSRSSSSSSSSIRAFRRSWAVWVCTPGPPHPPLAAPFASKEREEPFAMCQIHIYDWLIFSLQVIASDDTRRLNYHTWSLILSTVGEND